MITTLNCNPTCPPTSPPIPTATNPIPANPLLNLFPDSACGTCISSDATLTNSGIGNYNLGMSDCEKLVNCEGFDYFKNHKGGTGDTLQIAGYGDSIHLRWAYGALANITTQNSWTGQTDKGLRLGDSLDTFQGLYPGSTQTNPQTYTSGNLTATFTEGTVSKLGISK